MDQTPPKPFLRANPSLHRRRIEATRVLIPCWPNPSQLTLLLTRGLVTVVFGYFLMGMFFALILMFAFEQMVDNVLWAIGYDTNTVSYFPFLRDLYSHLRASPRIGDLNLTYFHILDIAVSLSILVWGVWLAIGILFLKQYDAYFGVAVPRIVASYERKRFVLYVGWSLMLSSPFLVTYLLMQPKLTHDPEIAWLITNHPKVLFFILAMMYHFGGFLISFTVLFLAWKIFRDNWPGVVLWHAD
jgi:hypothetical protein